MRRNVKPHRGSRRGKYPALAPTDVPGRGVVDEVRDLDGPDNPDGLMAEGPDQESRSGPTDDDFDQRWRMDIERVDERRARPIEATPEGEAGERITGFVEPARSSVEAGDMPSLLREP